MKLRNYIPEIFLFSAFVLVALRFYAQSGRLVLDVSNVIPRSGKWEKRDVSRVDEVVIHHTGGEQNLLDYNLMHIEERGWPSLSYHYYITPDGYVFLVNPINRKTWHNSANNTTTIGIALQGDLTRRPETDKQRAALLRLLALLKRQQGVIKLSGHKENVATICPGNLPLDFYRTQTGLK